jgi:hypothetical protein
VYADRNASRPPSRLKLAPILHVSDRDLKRWMSSRKYEFNTSRTVDDSVVAQVKARAPGHRLRPSQRAGIRRARSRAR